MRVVLLLVVSVVSLSSSAFAQREFDIERFTPALDRDGFIAVQGTRTPGHLRYSLGLFGHYALSPLQLDVPGGGQLTPVEHRLASVLSGELGLGPRAALGVSLPLVLLQEGERSGLEGSELASFALADPRVVARYRFLGESDEDNPRRDGPGVAVQADLRVPVGDDDAFAGEGAARLQLELLGDFHVLGAGVGGSLGFRHRFHERTLADRTVRDEFLFGAAIKLPIPPLVPLMAMFETTGATDFASAATTVVEGSLGFHLPVDDFTFALAAGRRFSGGIGAPDLRVVLGLWYQPAVADVDGDGIPDDEDACPPLPEDFDGFQDEDGCPDPDNDNDLIPDADDLCPNEEALVDQDDNEDGCTD